MENVVKNMKFETLKLTQSFLPWLELICKRKPCASFQYLCLETKNVSSLEGPVIFSKEVIEAHFNLGNTICIY